MADDTSNSDPFDQLMQQKMAQSKTETTPSQDPFDVAMSNRKGVSPSGSAVDPYEQKVKGYMPEARAYYSSSDPTVAAIKEGFQRTPILGPALNEVGADIEAALPSSLTGLKGDSYLDRRQDFKARSEALTRAGTEKSPIAAGAAELAGSFALPIGGISGAVEKRVAEAAPSVSEIIPKMAGMAAEAGTYSGLSAAAEKAFGTQPEKDQPSILGEAALGTAFGAALPGIGKVAGTVAEHVLPDWALEKLSNDKNYYVKQFVKHVKADEDAGENILGLKGAVDALKNGQDIIPFDVGGTRTQNWLQKTFKGRGDVLDGFQDVLNQRLSGAGDTFDAAMRDAAGIKGDFNLDALKSKSEQYARELNDKNYQAEAYNPENGRGIWNSRWEPQFRDPDAINAINDTNQYFLRKNNGRFESPIGRLGSSPIADLGLSARAESMLDKAGFRTIDDVLNTKPQDLTRIFQPPEAPSAKGALEAAGFPTGYLKEISDQEAQDLMGMMKLQPKVATSAPTPETSQLINEIKKATQGINPNRITLVNPNNINVEYLDQLQRRLGKRADDLYSADPKLNVEFAKRLRNLQSDIIGSMKGPVSPDGVQNKFFNPATYNAAFEKAHNDSRMAHRRSSAFESGSNFFKLFNDGMKSSKLMNDVKKMNPTEHNMFAQGMLGQMVAKATTMGLNGERNLNYNMVKKWFGNKDLMTSMEDALGSVKFAKLQNTVKSLAIANESAKRAKQLVSKSGGQGNSILNKDIVPAIAGIMLDAKLGLGGVFYNHVLEPYMGRKYATKIRSMLESGNIEKMTQAYDEMMSNPKTRTPFLDTLAHIGATNLPQMSSAISRSYRADGGSVFGDDDVMASAAPINVPHSLKELQNWNKNRPNLQQSIDNTFSNRVSVIDGAPPIAIPASITELKSYRTGRSTGGRIPEADKLFKTAKKEVDGQTKSLLHEHDDDIVKALRIAQGLV